MRGLAAGGLTLFEQAQRLDRGRGRDQQQRHVLGRGAQPGGEAGVVDDAVLLLERRVVLLVDDDKAEVRHRQEEGRAGADDDAREAPRRRLPGAAALHRGEAGVPQSGLGAEARGKALQPLRAERDLGQQDEDGAPGRQRLVDRFEVDFGLAGPRQSFEEEEIVAARPYPLAQVGGGGGLLGAEADRGDAAGVRGGGLGLIDLDPDEQALVGHRLQGRGRDAGGAGEVGRRHRPRILKRLDDPGAACVQGALRRLAQAVDPLDRPRLERLRRAQAQAQHGALGRQRLAGEPLDRAPQTGRHRRQVEDLAQILQLGRIDLRRGRGVPDDADDLAPAEGHADVAAGFGHLAVGDTVVEGPFERQRHEDGNAQGHGI